MDSLDRNRFYELLISICWLFLWNIIFINPASTRSCQESLLWISQYFVLKYTIFQYFFQTLVIPTLPLRALYNYNALLHSNWTTSLISHGIVFLCLTKNPSVFGSVRNQQVIEIFRGQNFSPGTSHWELILLYVCYRKPQISPMLLLNRETVCLGLLLRSLFALMRQSMLSLWFTSHISVAQ